MAGQYMSEATMTVSDKQMAAAGGLAPAGQGQNRQGAATITAAPLSADATALDSAIRIVNEWYSKADSYTSVPKHELDNLIKLIEAAIARKETP